MTEKQIVVGQALLTALSKASPDLTAVGAEEIRLRENGYTERLDSRTLRFMEHLKLIEVLEPNERHPMLLRLTYKGFKAEEQGLGDYLNSLEEKKRAEHRANLAVIKGLNWNVGWFIANAIFSIVNILIAVHNSH